MSVMVIAKEAYGRIADYFIQKATYGGDIHIESLTYEEYGDIRGMDIAKRDEHIKNVLGCWVDRLYISNQLAYYYMYERDKKKFQIDIDRLEVEDIKGGVFVKAKDILKDLNSIRYNLMTNGGNSFAGPKDAERLDRAIDQLQGKIIADLEEVVAKKAVKP